ncbi:MAG: hypothetical protein ACK55I_04535, partial [bacterium]
MILSATPNFIPTSVLRPLTSGICHQTSALRPLSSVLRPLKSDLLSPPAALRHPPSEIRPLVADLWSLSPAPCPLTPISSSFSLPSAPPRAVFVRRSGLRLLSSYQLVALQPVSQTRLSFR